jgi:hypothetical protein
MRSPFLPPAVAGLDIRLNGRGNSLAQAEANSRGGRLIKAACDSKNRTVLEHYAVTAIELAGRARNAGDLESHDRWWKVAKNIATSLNGLTKIVAEDRETPARKN